MAPWSLAIAVSASLAGATLPNDRSFVATPPPPAPDYAQRTAWAAWRDGPASRRADVFYINPTTYKGPGWNQDTAETDANLWTDQSVTLRQLTAFAACCRLYQPRYRQASSRAFRSIDGEGSKAYDLAYSDVVRAFHRFVAQTGDRPFIIAGHSQGALHGLRLLEEEVAGTPLQRRLVVAYLPGIGIPVGLFGRALPGIAPCANPRATGCVASWNTYLGAADTAVFLASSGRRFTQRFGPGPGSAILCVNPLTFDLSEPAASADASKGALLGIPGPQPIPAATPHAVAAACDHGALRAEPAPKTKVDPLPGGVLHMYDIALFHADLAANATLRVSAWLHRNKHDPD